MTERFYRILRSNIISYYRLINKINNSELVLIVSFDAVLGGAFLGNKTAIRGWKLEFTSEETEALKSQTLFCFFFHIDSSVSGKTLSKDYDDHM